MVLSMRRGEQRASHARGATCGAPCTNSAGAREAGHKSTRRRPPAPPPGRTQGLSSTITNFIAIKYYFSEIAVLMFFDYFECVNLKIFVATVVNFKFVVFNIECTIKAIGRPRRVRWRAALAPPAAATAPTSLTSGRNERYKCAIWSRALCVAPRRRRCRCAHGSTTTNDDFR